MVRALARVARGIAESARRGWPETESGSIDEWANRAADGNLKAEIQRISKTIADQEVERNRAGHYPTLDAVAGYTISNIQNFGATQVDTRIASVGVELNLPIYQGGLVSSLAHFNATVVDGGMIDLSADTYTPIATTT